MNVLALLISFMALGISGLALFLNYGNQKESRHGAITQLQINLFQRAMATDQKFIEAQFYLDSILIKIADLSNDKDKKWCFEYLTKYLSNIKKVAEANTLLRKAIEEMDSVKVNKSKVLVDFQAMEAELRMAEAHATEIEKRCYLFLIRLIV